MPRTLTKTQANKRVVQMAATYSSRHRRLTIERLPSDEAKFVLKLTAVWVSDLGVSKDDVRELPILSNHDIVDAREILTEMTNWEKRVAANIIGSITLGV